MTAEQFILDYYNASEYEDVRDETTQRWDSLAKCMEEYYLHKLKLLGISDVVVPKGTLVCASCGGTGGRVVYDTYFECKNCNGSGAN